MQQISWLLSFVLNPETKTETSDPPSYKPKHLGHRLSAEQQSIIQIETEIKCIESSPVISYIPKSENG